MPSSTFSTQDGITIYSKCPKGLGHFEYIVMPFGLTKTPAIFQAVVNNVLRDFLNIFLFFYFNSILIYSKDLYQHIKHVNAVFQRFLENQLYVKNKMSSITFLGLIFERGQVHKDPEKAKAVTEWSTPQDWKQL